MHLPPLILDKVKKSLMKNKSKVVSASICFSLATLSLVPAHAQSSYDYEPKGFWIPLLLPIVKSFFAGAAAKLVYSWGEPVVDSLTKKPPAVNGANNLNGAVNPNFTAGAISQPLYVPPQATPGANPPVNPSAPPRPSLVARIVKVDNTGKEISGIFPAENSLQTGSRFIIQYLTNMPGIVLAQNRDGTQAIDTFPQVQVGPMVTNKLPATDDSYQLGGEPGLETFRVLFMPCVNQTPVANGQSNLPDLAQVITDFPSKSGGAYAPRKVTQAANEKATESVAEILTPLAMKSLSGCDATALVDASSKPFQSLGTQVNTQGHAVIAVGQPGEVLELLLTINHTR
jgi:hypothetical protein